MKKLQQIATKLSVISGNSAAASISKKEVLSELCNWTHPSLIVKPIQNKGLGVFTTTALRKGELLIVFGGRVITTAQIRLMPPELDMLVQVEEDLFFIPVDLDALGPAERINHSCDPNAGFSGQMSVVGIRALEAGEEVCIDYATCDARPHVCFQCECGTSRCRGSVTGRDWQILSLQARLGEYFQPFLKNRIGLHAISPKLAGNS